MTELLTFLVVGVGTYAARSVFIVGVGSRALSPEAERFLRNIGPAVLAALVAQLLVGDGVGAFLTSLPEVAGVLAAIGATLWRRTPLAGFVAGSAVFFLLDLLG
ncbi:MAG: AzlD domain-containing protein [Acidimicrobiia bacterium]|nr:AzlD domain-containing protein [Acidimicrobiia bacterium]